MTANNLNKSDQICPKCLKSNPQESSYCMFCGEPLKTTKSLDSLQNDSKICPKCKKTFSDEVKFCLYDGTSLDSYQEQDDKLQYLKRKPQNGPKNDISDKKSILDQFSGFEVSQESSYSNLPIELLRSSTSILNPSPKAPKEVKLLNTSDYFSVDVPQPNQTFSGFFLRTGLTLNNFRSYVITYIFIFALYLLWIVNKLSVPVLIQKPSIILVILLLSLVITLIFIFPVIMTGRLVARIQSRMEFKIETMFLVLNFAINLIVLQFSFPFPIIVFPGEMKIRSLPMKKELSNAIHSGLVASFFVFLTSSLIILGINVSIIWNLITDPIFLTLFAQNLMSTVNLGFLLSSLALSINLLPIGNMFGKLAKFKPKSYWTMVIIVYSMLLISVNLI